MIYAMASLKYGFFLNKKGILQTKPYAYLVFALCAFMVSLKCHSPLLNIKFVHNSLIIAFLGTPQYIRKYRHVISQT